MGPPGRPGGRRQGDDTDEPGPTGASSERALHESSAALHAANEALRRSNATLSAVIENSPLAIYALDGDGIVTMWNAAAEKIFGWSAAEVLGRFSPVERDVDLDECVARRGRVMFGDVVTGVEVKRATKDGREIDVSFSAAPMRDDEGRITGLLALSADVSGRVAAEAAARRSEARLAAVVQNLSDVITVVGPGSRLIYTSPAAQRLFGFTEGDESWVDPLSRVHPDDRERVGQEFAVQFQHAVPEPVAFRIRAADGSWRHVEAVAQDLTADPDVGGIVVTTRDVSERRRAEAMITDQARILRLVAQGAPLTETLSALCEVVESQASEALTSVMLVDGASRTLRLAAAPTLPPGFTRHLGAVPVAAGAGSCGSCAHLGTPVVTADVGSDPAWDAWRDVALAHGLRACWSTPILASSGAQVLGTFAIYFREPRGPSHEHERLVAMATDLGAIAIERKAFEDRLAHQAHHDALTGLPNRRLFVEFLEHSLARRHRRRSTVAVLFLDLDRFKVVNDSLGHETGDELLVELARRLQGTVRPADTLARLGGDEFTVLCEDLGPDQARDQAVDVAERLLQVVEEPFDLRGHEARLSSSIGIALAAGDDDPETLLRDADAAMYRAKEAGKGRWVLFDEEMRSSARQRLDTENALHHALEREELRLHFQPIVDVRTCGWVAAEALLRWQHPERGLLTPDSFVDIAEETGLIVPIGSWVLDETCRWIARWRDAGLVSDGFTVSVNLSARQVARADLVARLAGALRRSGVPPGMLCLEITERILMSETTNESVESLKRLGVRISIDDFGTGYASLGYLKRFPVDVVKIDRSFVGGLGSDPDDAVIVAAVVGLGHALGLTVVAEGVETGEQLRELAVLGCDQAQGFWFAPARPPEAFTRLLRGPIADAS